MLKAVLAQDTPGQRPQVAETVSKALPQGQLLANQAIGTALADIAVRSQRQVEPLDTTLGGEQRAVRTIDQARGVPQAGGFLRSYGTPRLLLSEPEPAFELAYAKHLLAYERVATARTVLERAIGKYPQDERLKALYRAIAPGRVERRDIQYRDRKAEAAWIQSHRAEYHGKWVALCGDEVLGISDDLQTVLRLVRQFQLEEPPLLHHFVD
jgi:hypothetical protein